MHRDRRINRHSRYRPNNRRHSPRMNGGENIRLGDSSFSNDRPRNNFNTQSAEKLLEKYNTLAKEALSSGDRILSENYFQHADHFMRIIESKKSSQNQTSPNNNKIKDLNTQAEPSTTTDQNPPSEEKKDIKI